MESILNVIAYALQELLTVQGLMAFTLTVGALILLSLDKTIPDWYIVMWSTVVGYYFRGVVQVQPMKNGKVIETIDGEAQ